MNDRHYLHGDRHNVDPTRFFCARCDLFIGSDHFDACRLRDQRTSGGWTPETNYALLLRQERLWDRAPARRKTRVTFDAPNLFR